MPVIITGISPTSIGATTALAVASQGPAALILASRTAAKVDAVAKEIGDKYPSVAVHKVPLDLSSLDSVRAAAAQVDALAGHLDVLINNAGACFFSRQPVRTPGDTEVDLQLWTNHLGPFLLTHLLLPKLLRAAAVEKGGAARIVNVSSHGHRLSPVRFHDYQIAHYVYDGVPDSEKPPPDVSEAFLRLVDGYPGFVGYGQSKTANILHATELTRRLRKKQQQQQQEGSGKGMLALSVHPGTIQTDLSRGLDDEGRAAIDSTAPAGAWKTLDQGAATTVVAAFDPRLADLDVGGAVVGYLADCQLAEGFVAEHARDPENARTLWEESERMLGVVTGL